MTKTISTTVTSTVVLDAGNGYGVIVASSGVIRVAGHGGDGISGTTGTVTNDGSIFAGAGTAATTGGVEGGNGGVGIYLPSGTISNAGTISGGAGGSSDYTVPGGGGAGVIGIDVMNTGHIYGGAGGYGGPDSRGGNNGGAGVITAHGTVTNSGFIRGGAGGAGPVPGNGGAGVVLTYSSMLNNGTVLGGNTNILSFPGYGGDGVSLDTGTLTNTGTIAGGYSGPGYTVPFLYSELRGAGVSVANGVLHNSGTISGGPSVRAHADGSVGVYANTSTILNTGTIVGGSAYYSGATGLVLVGGSAVNKGLITSGSAADNAQHGIGVEIDGGNFINDGTVTGATDSVFFTGTLTSTLAIDPGAVFNGAVVAADSHNVLILAYGYQAGTLSGLGTSPGTGVNFSGFSTLEEDSDATWSITGVNAFNGSATIAGVIDLEGRLALNGNAAGTGTVAVASGATLSGTGKWSLAVTDAGLIEATKNTLTLANVSGAGSLVAETKTTVDLTAGGTLTEKVSGAGTLELGGGSWHFGTSALTIGSLEIGAKVLLTDAGSIAATVTNNGTITAYGGALSFTKAVSGTGTFLIAETQTLSFGAGVTGQTVVFDKSGATLDLADPSGFAATLADFAAKDSIDLLRHVVTKDSFAAGTLTLTDGSTVVAALHFSGTYTAADFSIKSDGHGGTSIGFA